MRGVDTIASRAKANKGMIYHYFGKQGRTCSRPSWRRPTPIFRGAEQRLDLDKMDPVSAMTRMVEFTWKYYLANPEFLTLVNSENLHRGKHIAESVAIREMHRPLVSAGPVDPRSRRRRRVFRAGVDPVQLNITIAAIGYTTSPTVHTGR